MKGYRKVLAGMVGLWLLVIVATLPELTAVWPERKVVERTFSRYCNALISQKFEEAYAYQSTEFQKQINLAGFVQYQRDLQAKFGALKSVQRNGMTVRKWKNPPRWEASINADFQYEKATVAFDFELRRESDRWKIFSSKGKER